MSKTLTGNFTTEKNKTANTNVLVHLLEIVTPGGTVFYSDRAVKVDSQEYIANVLDWGDIENQLDTGENFIRVGEVNIRSSNSPRIDSTIDVGDLVSVYIWYNNLVTADKLKIFEGVISEDIRWNPEVISFSADDKSVFFNKIIWNPLQTDSFAGTPDPDDIGKQMPIVYGDYKNHIPLVIDTGGATTLNGAIDSSSTAAITVQSTTDPITFGNSGNIFIGREKIAYTGRTATTFTGITRGTGGTQATAHASGDGVFEDHLAKYLVANHITKTSGITNVRLISTGGKLSDAVNITSSVTTTEDDSGVSTISITAANVATLRNLINVAVDQQPAALDDSGTGHNHDITGAAEATLFGDGVDSSNNATNTGNAFDQNEGTFCLLQDNAGVRAAHIALDFNFAGFDGLEIVQATAVVRHAAQAAMDTYNIELDSVSFSTALDQSDTNDKTQKFIISALNGETNWSNLDGLKVDCIDGDSIVQAFVYEMWWEIQYTPEASDTKVNVATIASTEVVVTGDSVADSLGILICDIEGYQDDNPAHYTDSADSLIEEPWDVIHHLLENHGNSVTDSDLDLSGSFQDAEDNLPASYKFAFAINTRRSTNRLFALLARQTFCRAIVESGIIKLVRIKTSGTSSKSLDTDDDSVLKSNRIQVNVRKRGLSEIANDLEIKYNLNPTLGGWDDPEAYEGSSTTTDATSITAYGTRQKSWLMFGIGDNSTMADDLVGKLKTLLKDPRQEITFPSFLKNIELERGDVVDITSSQLGFSASDVEVINTKYTPFAGGQDPEIELTGLVL